jgi:hypothetical protein
MTVNVSVEYVASIFKETTDLLVTFRFGFFPGLFFGLEDGGQIWIWIIGWLSTDIVVLYPRKYDSSRKWLFWKSFLEILLLAVCMPRSVHDWCTLPQREQKRLISNYVNCCPVAVKRKWYLFHLTEPVASQYLHSEYDTCGIYFKRSTIWGFHGCDYEEWSLLGYNRPVRTSQETHYMSPSERSLIMPCKIWGFHGCDYKECRLLGYDVVWLM